VQRLVRLHMPHHMASAASIKTERFWRVDTALRSTASINVVMLRLERNACVKSLRHPRAAFLIMRHQVMHMSDEPIILRNLVATPLCPDSRIMPSSDPLTQLWFPAGLKGFFRPRSCGVLCSKSAA
jgi:hypothetical protein